MISQQSLEKFTKKYQTTKENIAREYCQHLFLSSLYRLPSSEKLLFKGGTALRFVCGSSRFSEDLDFTGINIYSLKLIEDLFVDILSQIELMGIDISLKEAKSTTGGYLGVIHYNLYGLSEDIRFEISLRNGKRLKREIITIINDFIPAYTMIHLPSKEIVEGKVAALINRKKPRDFYDFYYILRHPELHRYIEKETLVRVKDILHKTQINFRKELSVLLPISHQMILRDFKPILVKEIEKNI